MKALMKSITEVKRKGLLGLFSSVKNRGINMPDKIFMSIRLRKLLDEQKKCLEDTNIEEIRERTLKYIENLRIKENSYGQYRYCSRQKLPVLYASCYAALTRHLYRDLESLTEKQRKEWVEYIQSFQSDNGLFRDPNIENDIAENSDWWGWRHLTVHALMALNALGAVAKKRLMILEPFKNATFAIQWLESKDWTFDPATTSNEVQNYFTILQYMRDFHHEGWANKILRITYQWLNEKQDHETGLWGVRPDSPLALSEGVQTGYHIWLLYFYDKEPIQYVDQIIDTCLATQNTFGGFGVPLNSSACEDIDSIDPLVRLGFLTDYRKRDIIKALEETLPWVLVNMNKDGGFVFRRMEPFTYGHPLMFSGKNVSALFPTWFRTLSLAYISRGIPDCLLGKFDWQFLNCPGYQFSSF